MKVYQDAMNCYPKVITSKLMLSMFVLDVNKSKAIQMVNNDVHIPIRGVL